MVDTPPVPTARTNDPPSLREERGQVIVLFAVALVVLLGFVGLVVDIGHAYFVQRSLQQAADAAALAGAADLPDGTVAVSTAKAYGSTRGKRNDQSRIGPVRETIELRCLVSIRGCAPHNAVVVTEEADVTMSFLAVLGLTDATVHVKATACSPCGARPLDIMLVLDRTGSMCLDHSGRSDPNCTDLRNAKDGMETFLGLLDPTIDHVGLAVLPPASRLSRACNTPSSTNNYAYSSTTAPYVLVPMSDDYKFTDGGLNGNSNLVKTLRCVQGGGSTAYANAIEKAQAELDAHGRPGITDVIIFFSDGAANTGPGYYAASSPYRKQPCRQGVTSAGAAKAKKTIVYSIGYDLNALDGGANKCTADTGANEDPAITAYQALQQMASGPDTFYTQPSAGELSTLFEKVAADIGRGTAKLVPNETK